MPSDKSADDIILPEAGLPLPSPPGFPSSGPPPPPLPPPTPGFKVQPSRVREPGPDAALSRAPAHAAAHAARHVRGGGAGTWRLRRAAFCACALPPCSRRPPPTPAPSPRNGLEGAGWGLGRIGGRSGGGPSRGLGEAVGRGQGRTLPTAAPHPASPSPSGPARGSHSSRIKAGCDSTLLEPF